MTDKRLKKDITTRVWLGISGAAAAWLAWVVLDPMFRSDPNAAQLDPISGIVMLPIFLAFIVFGIACAIVSLVCFWHALHPSTEMPELLKPPKPKK